MCGEKQSLKHVYGIGSGKECRLIVQKLSEKNMQTDLMTSHKVEGILDGTIKIQEKSSSNIRAEPPEKSVWSDFLPNFTEKVEDTLPQTNLIAVPSNFYVKPEKKSYSSSYSTKFNPYTKLPKLVGYHNKEGSQSSKEITKSLSIQTTQEKSNENIKSEPDSCSNEQGGSYSNLFKHFAVEEEEDTLPQSSLSTVASNFYTKPTNSSSSRNLLKPVGYHKAGEELSASLENHKKVELPEIPTNNDYWGTDNLNDEELDDLLKLDF